MTNPVHFTTLYEKKVKQYVRDSDLQENTTKFDFYTFAGKIVKIVINNKHFVPKIAV